MSRRPVHYYFCPTCEKSLSLLKPCEHISIEPGALALLRRKMRGPIGDRFVARELRRLRFVTGGRGVFVLVERSRFLPTAAACNALERAAGRLGFGNSWRGVVKALSAWALPDVLSEAIEEQES
jgi:hypothetical protein